MAKLKFVSRIDRRRTYNADTHVPHSGRNVNVFQEGADEWQAAYHSVSTDSWRDGADGEPLRRGVTHWREMPVVPKRKVKP